MIPVYFEVIKLQVFKQLGVDTNNYFSYVVSFQKQTWSFGEEVEDLFYIFVMNTVFYLVMWRGTLK